ncbi:MAG: hypothetical protein WC100_22635, partial [Sterolibacterium sp.]
HFTYALAANPGAYTYGTTASRTAKTTSSGVTCSSGTVTVNTAASHGFSVNQWVNISGITPVGYNGTYQITSVVSTTRFRYALGASCPGSSSVAGFVTATNDIVSASWASGTVTVTTSQTHNLGKPITNTTWASAPSPGQITVTAAGHDFFVGQTVTVSGVSPSGYNGSFVIVAVAANTFTFDAASDPGAYVSGGWASAGDRVSISGISPTGYNGTYPVTVTGATEFTYALATNPGGTFSNATFATSGFSTVKSPYFPAGGALPTSTTIHVRLDLTRSYSASAKQATFTLKAYMDNLFPVASVCSASDFQNLSRDLSFLCPSRTPTIEQDSIVINDVSGPALANIYVGFTTARGTSTADNQNISISNILLRSQ